MLRGREQKKAITPPLNYIFNFLVQKTRIQFWLYDKKDMRIEGVIVGFDEYMNVVLVDAEEVYKKTNKRVKVGRILLKGDNITLMQPVSAQQQTKMDTN